VRGLFLEAILIGSILLPFIDRSARSTARERYFAITLGVAVLLLWLLFTWIGYRMEVGP
jgi:quinol-cytochrome oxidoreductase complex cytochrome b subunit